MGPAADVELKPSRTCLPRARASAAAPRSGSAPAAAGCLMSHGFVDLTASRPRHPRPRQFVVMPLGLTPPPLRSPRCQGPGIPAGLWNVAPPGYPSLTRDEAAVPSDGRGGLEIGRRPGGRVTPDRPPGTTVAGLEVTHAFEVHLVTSAPMERMPACQLCVHPARRPRQRTGRSSCRTDSVGLRPRAQARRGPVEDSRPAFHQTAYTPHHAACGPYAGISTGARQRGHLGVIAFVRGARDDAAPGVDREGSPADQDVRRAGLVAECVRRHPGADQQPSRREVSCLAFTEASRHRRRIPGRARR